MVGLVPAKNSPAVRATIIKAPPMMVRRGFMKNSMSVLKDLLNKRV